MTKTNKAKVFFRADAGAEIGYGHFIRTLALADMLKDEFDCTFFTQSPTEYQKQEASSVCNLIALPSDNTRHDIFLDYLTGEEIVVLDNYFFTTEYQRRIRSKGCKLVCIDDMHDKYYVADIVINHGAQDAAKFSVEPYTKLCLGLDWALLRSPFLSPQSKRRVEGSWLLCFGGSDTYNLTKRYLDTLLTFGNLSKIFIVIGDSFSHKNTIPSLPNIEVCEKLSAVEMANIMDECECGIIPSSGTCIESISRGCKVISGWYVENQLELYSTLVTNHYVYGIGDMLRTSLTSMLIEDVFSKYKLNQFNVGSVKENYVNLFKTC